MSYIKMRGWDVDNKKFLPVERLLFDINCVLISKSFYEEPKISRSLMKQTVITLDSGMTDHTHWDELLDKEKIAWLSAHFKNKPGNFTGKKIFESDIIKIHNYHYTILKEVKFLDGMFCVVSGIQLESVRHVMCEFHVKVVGNIFENKELILDKKMKLNKNEVM